MFCGGSKLCLCDTQLLVRNTDCAENYWMRSFRCLLDCYLPETLAQWEWHVSFCLRHLSKYYVIKLWSCVKEF